MPMRRKGVVAEPHPRTFVFNAKSGLPLIYWPTYPFYWFIFAVIRWVTELSAYYLRSSQVGAVWRLDPWLFPRHILNSTKKMIRKENFDTRFNHSFSPVLVILQNNNLLDFFFHILLIYGQIRARQQTKGGRGMPCLLRKQNTELDAAYIKPSVKHPRRPL